MRASGLSEEDAVDEALRRLGEPGPVSEEYRKTERRSGWASWSLDLRLAARQFRSNPIFTLVAAASVGIAIASNTLAFSIFNGLLLTDPGYGDSEALVEVYTGDIEDPSTQSVSSWPMAEDLRARSELFDGVTAYEPLLGRMLIEGEYSPAMGEVVDRHYFDVLRVQPVIGRWFDDEDVSSEARVVVLAWDTWVERLDSRGDAIGLTIEVNGEPFTVIGVAPEGFGGAIAGLAKHLWVPSWVLPLGPDPLPAGATPPTRDRERWLAQVKGRLRDGVSAADAQAALSASLPELTAAWPISYDGVRFRIIPTDDVALSPAVDRVAYSLAGVVMSVLLAVLVIACMNLAGFLLARGADRWNELQLRLALGATRARLVGQLFLESLVIAVAGGAIGLALCALGLQFLSRIELPIPIELAFVFEVDATVLLFTFAATLFASVLFGLAPAWHSTKDHATRGVARHGGSRTTGSGRIRSLILGGQVAVSLVFLIAGGLLSRSLRAEVEVDPGFRTAGAGIVTVELASGDIDRDRLPDLIERIRSATRGRDGVRDLVFTSRVPMGAVTSSAEVSWASETPEETREIQDFSVSPGWFEHMRIPLIEGRAFGTSDDAQGDAVVIISREMADLLATDDISVGDFIRVDEREHRIVGVAEDVRIERPREAPQPHMYRPLTQTGAFLLSVVGIADRESAQAVASVRSAIQQVDPTLQIWSAGTLEGQLDVKLMGARIAAGLLTGSAAIALLLTLVGVFGTVRYAAARRAPEMAVRLSLGASGASVTRLMITSMVRVIAVGAVIGLALASVLALAMRSLLFGVPALDLLVFVPSTIALIGMAVLAAYLPARRMGRTDLRQLFAGDGIRA